MSPGDQMRRASLEALLLLVVGAGNASAQYVRLRVTNDADDAPVPRAQVVSLSDRAIWRTDDTGIIVVTTLHPGPNVFTIRHLGLAPITTTLNVREHDTLKVHVVMSPAPQVLDPVDIKARATAEMPLSVFDDRRLHSAGGHFITWADIQRQQPFETLDLFRGMLGVRVVRPATGDPIVESTRGVGVMGGSCPLRVGLDGMVFGNTSGFDINDISPREIYGVEIYSGAATIPGRYLTSTAGGSCGLIMIWTADGARQTTKRR
jgi:hypothetical protein